MPFRLAAAQICCNAMNPKQRAADAALSLLHSDMVVGLGTGSTADYFLQALAAAIKDGRLRNIRAIPTSRQSERRAHHLGIPLTTFVQCPVADVTVDGADEIDPQLNLIKGLGGALLREKIVAQNSHHLVIIADASKEVPALGTKSPLPVEVISWAHESQEAYLRSLGCEPLLRRDAAGEVFTTDNGNVIYDCRFPRIDNPAHLESTLRHRAGIVESGLFVSLAKTAFIADPTTVRHRMRQ
jgi:ribose 5-phosphate isomerase A